MKPNRRCVVSFALVASEALMAVMPPIRSTELHLASEALMAVMPPIRSTELLFVLITFVCSVSRRNPHGMLA